MTVHTYEIRKRPNGNRLGGMNAIFIDGEDTEYMNDPTQHAENAMARVLARNGGESLAPDKLAVQVDGECERISRHCLNRVIKRIQAGSLMPGGYVPQLFKSTTPKGKGPFLSTSGGFNPNLPSNAVENMNLTGEEREDFAVESFLNRGSFSVRELDDAGQEATRPLTKEERIARHAKRKEIDHTELWKKGRKALFDERSAALKKAQEEQAKIRSIPERGKIQKRIDALLKELNGLKEIKAASQGYQFGYGQIMQAVVNFLTADMRMVPVMTNTTADTERDAITTVANFTTLDEFNGSGYTTGGLALDNKAINIDDANNRAEFDCDDEVVANLAAGVRSIAGLIIIKFVTSLTLSLPLFYIEFATPKTPDGSNFTFQINTEGLIQVKDGV